MVLCWVRVSGELETRTAVLVAIISEGTPILSTILRGKIGGRRGMWVELGPEFSLNQGDSVIPHCITNSGKKRPPSTIP